MIAVFASFEVLWPPVGTLQYREGPRMDESRPWHRLFGLSLMDFFHDAPVVVEMEQDLSKKQQLLDVVLIRKEGPLNRALPDGFDDLAAHNLISFKSYQETLDHWALEELIGHYVNYRKQTSPSMQNLLPVTDFRLFAVSVRFPQTLASEFALAERSPGVYDLRRFGGWLRIIVVNRLPLQDQNAVLHLFGAQAEQVVYGVQHYRQRSPETSTVLAQLFERYRAEGMSMSEQMERFMREALEEVLRNLPVEERLRGLSPEERLKGLSPEERLKGVSEEERVKGVAAGKRLAGLSVQEILAELPPEEREALRRALQQQSPTDKPA